MRADPNRVHVYNAELDQFAHLPAEAVAAWRSRGWEPVSEPVDGELVADPPPAAGLPAELPPAEPVPPTTPAVKATGTTKKERADG